MKGRALRHEPPSNAEGGSRSLQGWRRRRRHARATPHSPVLLRPPSVPRSRSLPRARRRPPRRTVACRRGRPDEHARRRHESRRGIRSSPPLASPRAKRDARATAGGCGPAPGRRAHRRNEAGARTVLSVGNRTGPDLGCDQRFPASVAERSAKTPSTRPYIGAESNRRVPFSHTAAAYPPRAGLLVRPHVEGLHVPSPTTGTSHPVRPNRQSSIMTRP